MLKGVLLMMPLLFYESSSKKVAIYNEIPLIVVDVYIFIGEE
ncbi:hypothetical protein [Carboxylicivirga taeanensis]